MHAADKGTGSFCAEYMLPHSSRLCRYSPLSLSRSIPARQHGHESAHYVYVNKGDSECMLGRDQKIPYC